MTEVKIKKIFFLATLLFFVFFPLFFLYAQRLEVNYPEIQGEKPTPQTLFPEYVRYVFKFVIWSIGAIAVIVLVIGGLKYISSGGNAAQLKEAKQQILGAFWGIILLLSSYILLTYINPQLVVFDLKEPESVPLTVLDLPPLTKLTPNLLEKIENLAQNAKLTVSGSEKAAEELVSLTQKCDCQNSESFVLCPQGGGVKGSQCEAKYCYIKDNAIQPCPDGPKITAAKKNVVGFQDEALYYRNRALAEEKDLRDEIEKIIDKDIEFFERSAAQETEGNAKKDLQGQTDRLKKEKRLKTELADLLRQLAEALEKSAPPIFEISQLPDQCYENVENTDFCKPSYKTEEQNQCHNTRKGCQPDKCGGGNPCPMGEIQNRKSQISSNAGAVQSISEKILQKIQEIIEFKSIFVR